MARFECDVHGPDDGTMDCRGCRGRWVAESRADQGLPPTVEDPATARRVSELLASTTARTTETDAA